VTVGRVHRFWRSIPITTLLNSYTIAMHSYFKLWLCLVVMLVLAPAVTGQSIDPDAPREKWQRVPDLFAAMGVREGAVVADVGAGNGFLTVRLAAAVGSPGKVYAVDIVPDVLKRLRERLAKANISNVDVIEGTEDDPRLPKGALDAVVMINAYHEVAQAATVLQRFREALKPGGRVVLCEPRPKTSGRSRADQMKGHVLSPDLIVEDLKVAGFEIVSREDSFTANPSGPEPEPYSLVVARKP
jgi:predicted methyltransferase